MRKNNLMTEYDASQNVPGSFYLEQIKSFFGTQLLTSEPEIKIDDSIITYFDANNQKHSLFLFDYKRSRVQFNIDSSQPEEIRKERPIWNFTIDTREILFEYLRSMLRKYKIFDSLNTDLISYNNIGEAIDFYCRNNLLNIYKFEELKLYVQYKKLNEGYLYLTPVYEKLNIEGGATLDFYRESNISIEAEGNLPQTINAGYRQRKDAREETFSFNYDLIYKKI